MLFFSFFKTYVQALSPPNTTEPQPERIRSQADNFKSLTGEQISVELKNSITIRGTLKSVDQYLNIKLEDVLSVLSPLPLIS
jgi:hypothetical protein